MPSFLEFFYRAGGKLKRHTTKPRLTLEKMKERLEFAMRWLGKLESGEKLYYCFLDEKWFYTTSRRKKFNVLPKALFEDVKDAFFIPPKLRSRRHPCKVMFMGVVVPPIINQNGNIDLSGKVWIKRVSKTNITGRGSRNQNFVPGSE